MPALNPGKFPFREGMIYLGRDPATGRDVGLPIDRQALTIAGQGAGKGSCQIIPNLLRWPHSSVVIDPSGEAAAATAAHRARAFGQKVLILDPFDEVPGLDDFKGSVNPLDYAEGPDDFAMLADALIMRQEFEAQSHFTDSARAVCAGLLATVKLSPLLKHRFIPAIRNLIEQLHNTTKNAEGQSPRSGTLELMRKAGDFPGKAAARLSASTNEIASVLSTLDTQTFWIDSPKMAGAILQTSVDLSALKQGGMTVYLVLPPDRITTNAPFLRLFVRLCLSIMWKRIDGRHKATPCLFLLDEFAALGRIDDLLTALPQGRKYGLHIWPFVQNWGQLESAYGKARAQDFLASTDLVSYFGLDDPDSLRHLSDRFGSYSETEAQAFAMQAQRDKDRAKRYGGVSDLLRPAWSAPATARAEAKIKATEHKLRGPRRRPDDLQALLAPPRSGEIAKAMLIYTPQGWLELEPAPYFRKPSLVRRMAQLARGGVLGPFLRPLAFLFWLPARLLSSRLAIGLATWPLKVAARLAYFIAVFGGIALTGLWLFADAPPPWVFVRFHLNNWLWDTFNVTI